MISPKLHKIWYGADYNPDQWPEETWDEDVRLMKLAHVDVATLPVFSWTLLQPAEDRYSFEWLDRILDKLAGAGIYACIATSTAAQPAWMSLRYPDVLRTDVDGSQAPAWRADELLSNQPQLPTSLPRTRVASGRALRESSCAGGLACRERVRDALLLRKLR